MDDILWFLSWLGLVILIIVGMVVVAYLVAWAVASGWRRGTGMPRSGEAAQVLDAAARYYKGCVDTLASGGW